MSGLYFKERRGGRHTFFTNIDPILFRTTDVTESNITIRTEMVMPGDMENLLFALITQWQPNER